MITEPKQDIFIKMFNNIMTNINSIINIFERITQDILIIIIQL